MASQALYRKYRSADFSEVVGQEHVVKTLMTAIASGRLSHAYLFTGPRGVGKTSVARLLARALNCTGDPEKGRPCNNCFNCKAAINSSLDIIEIDAASNRSIDAVRDLREKVNLAPTTGQYKVYIIDEVHMLTTEAFNALLKTLEEPPAHAVFILATTEAHKLPETIVSRTQSFNFKPISDANIVMHLAKIAKEESIDIETAALEILATSARGGFRDAIGMLDQVSSSGTTPITAEVVRVLLGYSDAEAIGTISRAIAAANTKDALDGLALLVEQGIQPGQLAVQLVEQWRLILMASVGNATANQPIVAELATQLKPARIAGIIEVLLEVTRSHWPQLALEVAIVRLTAAPETTPHVAQVVPAPRAKAQTVAKPAAVEPEAPAIIEAAPTAGQELWPKVLVILKTKNTTLGALLQMYPVEFTEAGITIKSRYNFHRDLFNKPVNRQIIEGCVQKVYGRAIAINAVIDETAVKSPKATVDPNSELVSSALEILGGEVIE